MVPRRYVHVREPSGAVGTVTRARDHRRGRTLCQVGPRYTLACTSVLSGFGGFWRCNRALQHLVRGCYYPSVSESEPAAALNEEARQSLVRLCLPLLARQSNLVGPTTALTQAQPRHWPQAVTTAPTCAQAFSGNIRTSSQSRDRVLRSQNRKQAAPDRRSHSIRTQSPNLGVALTLA